MERRRDSDRPVPAKRPRAWMHEPTVPARRAVRAPVDDEPKPRRGRFALTGSKVVLGVVSALVLAATGYYSSQLTDFGDDMTRYDVIAGGEDDGPPIDGAVDILLVGMDSRTDPQGNPLSKKQLAMLNAGKADGVLNTDTIILIHIPVEGGKATGISIPRDSYVDIPGYGKHKINSAYARKKNDAMAELRANGTTDRRTLAVESNRQGAVSLISTVQQLTGVTIDHYAEINLLGFYDITTAIGGIDVCLKEPVRDKDSGANFPAGRQTLSGAPALSFVRQRKGLPNGDIDRVARQQVFLSGMAKKVFSADLLAPGSDTMEKLQQAVVKSVVLDQGWNIVEFAQQMVSFTGGNLEFQTIPHGDIGMPTPEDGKAVEVDPAEVKDFIRGVIPDEDDATPQAPADGTPDPASITVSVRNAAQVDDLAGDVADVLTGAGFTIGLVDDATTREATVVRHAPGERAAADLVIAALAGPALAEEDANQQPGQVTVLLGQDYPTPDGLARPGLVDLGAAAQPADGDAAVRGETCVY